MGYPHLLQLARATLAAAEPGDCEDGEQGDGNDADPDGAPQSRGQDSYAEVRRCGLPSGRAGADRRLIVAGNGACGRGQGDFDLLRLARREFAVATKFDELPDR
jgi:hypothetical protein